MTHLHSVLPFHTLISAVPGSYASYRQLKTSVKSSGPQILECTINSTQSWNLHVKSVTFFSDSVNIFHRFYPVWAKCPFPEVLNARLFCRPLKMGRQLLIRGILSQTQCWPFSIGMTPFAHSTGSLYHYH